MQFARNRTIATITALFLVLTAAFSLVALPRANAQVQRTYISHCYVAASPLEVGVGQRMLVFAWMWTLPPNTIEETAQGGPAAGAWPSWHDLIVNVVQPSGSNVTIGPLDTDSAGGTYSSFTPTEVGIHTFQTYFPGETKNTTSFGTSYTTYYQPDWSEPYSVEILAEEQPTTASPAWPLPTGYWERPINYENQEWAMISGAWYGIPSGYGSAYGVEGRFNPYTTAPNTAHVVWQYEIGFGGVAGGYFPENPGVSYYTGVHYEARFTPTAAMNGVLFFPLPKNTERNTGGTVAVDIRTGEQLWWSDFTLAFAQVLDFESPNQHGVIEYLWDIPPMFGGTGPQNQYRIFDPNTGQLLYNYENITRGGTVTRDVRGNILIYFVGGSYPNRWMAMWNSSHAQGNYQGVGEQARYSWRPTGKTINWADGIQWNKTFTGVSGNPSISKLPPVEEDQMFLWSTAYTQSDGTVVNQDTAFDLRTGKELNVLWGPVNRTAKSQERVSVMRGGYYATWNGIDRVWYGYSATTGKALWGPSETVMTQEAQYAMTADTAYGIIVQQSYGGTLYAFNITTGETMWKYNETVNPSTPYGHNPFWEGISIGDGKVFCPTYEHSQNNPPYKGAKIYAINITTGELVWKLTGWYYGYGVVMHDGYMVQWMLADNQLYCFGKGQTATTVNVPETVQPLGTPVLVKGSVTDQSPSPKVKDTPAIADANMTEWMEYIYMQKPMPTNAEGVEVVLTVLDPNNNVYEIGRTTSDASGLYSLMWTPLVPGKYTITATFGGSESYFASSSETALGVVEAPEETLPPEQVPTDLTPVYTTVIGGVIAIIVAVALAVVLLLKKR